MTTSRNSILLDVKKKTATLQHYLDDDDFHQFATTEHGPAIDTMQPQGHDIGLPFYFPVNRLYGEVEAIDTIIFERVNELRLYLTQKGQSLDGFNVNALKGFLLDPVELVEYLTRQINYGGIEADALVHDIALLRWFIWGLIAK